MFFQIIAYFKFLWNSKNQHGIHSPFVFDLVTKCFYDKKPKPEYAVLNQYRNSLLRNKDFIEVTDFGSGSRVFKSNKRQVSKIAATAGISPKRARLLLRVVNYFQPAALLEIGTSLGLATAALSVVNPRAKITTLEGCPETSKIAQEQFQEFGLTNINAVVTEFSAYLKSAVTLSAVEGQQPTTYQLVYFDGNHSKEATLNYFELLLPAISNDSVWIFDDIHWSKGMEEAWEEIKQHPKVTVTIDTFQWGFVFFRTEQEKEHFVVRA